MDYVRTLIIKHEVERPIFGTYDQFLHLWGLCHQSLLSNVHDTAQYG